MATSSVMKRYTSISGNASTAAIKSIVRTKIFTSTYDITIGAKSVRTVSKTRVAYQKESLSRSDLK